VAARRGDAVKLRCERAGGQFLRDLERRPGTRTDLSEPPERDSGGSHESDVRHVSPYRQALEVAGVDERVARNWQAEAVLSDAAFEEYVQRETEPTSAALLREVRLHRRAEQARQRSSAEPPPLSALGPFDVLLADPPWRYEHAEPSRAVELHYPTMSTDEICALDVPACSPLRWSGSVPARFRAGGTTVRSPERTACPLQSPPTGRRVAALQCCSDARGGIDPLPTSRAESNEPPPAMPVSAATALHDAWTRYRRAPETSETSETRGRPGGGLGVGEPVEGADPDVSDAAMRSETEAKQPRQGDLQVPAGTPQARAATDVSDVSSPRLHGAVGAEFANVWKAAIP